MPHLSPLDRETAPQELRDVFELYEQTRGFVPNSLRTMARRPNILRAFADLNQAVLYEGTVDPGLKVLVSIVTSLAAGCKYCQSHMVTRADVLGVSAEKIDAVWDFETSELFDDAERAALRLGTAGGSVPNTAEPHHFEELRRHFDEDQIVEVVATVALFGYLNRWNDTMATELESFSISHTRDVLAPGRWDAGKHAPLA